MDKSESVATTLSETELDAEFNALPEKTQEMIKSLGEEWGQDIVNENKNDVNLLDFLDKAPRKLKRKLQPEKKFGNQLLNRLKK